MSVERTRHMAYQQKFCVVQQVTFYRHQDYEQVVLNKKLHVLIMGCSARDGKFTFSLQLAQNWNFSKKNGQNLLFSQHSKTLYDVMQRENESLEVVQSVDFEFIYSLKYNGIKYLLIFDDSCEEICNSTALIDIATTGRHQRLSTIYINHKLFCQSKLGRDVDFQNTHIVLFKSTRDVMQVSKLSAQLDLGSELVDWFRDATSVPYGNLSIGLSPRTDDRLPCCTNSGMVETV